jgi:hypothetical protein
MLSIDKAKHREISADYSRILPFTEGLTLRKWLAGKPIEYQRQFGANWLKSYGVK